MGKNYLLNRLGFASNHAGVAIFYLGTITNDCEATSDLHALTKNNLANFSNTEQLYIETKNFEPLASSNVNLIHDMDSYDEEQAILDFANKLLGSSRDIEPEINSIIQAHFWELL